MGDGDGPGRSPPVARRESPVASRMGKLLLVLGLVIAGIGLLIMWGLPIGRLPGDVTLRRGSTTLYFPIVTSIVVSLLLTLIFALFRR
jgi:Mg2+/citrate symporter